MIKLFTNLPNLIAVAMFVFGGYQWVGHKIQSVHVGSLKNQIEAKSIELSTKNNTITELQKTAINLKVKENQIKIMEDAMAKMQQEVNWARDRVSKREKLVSTLRAENAELSTILDSRIPADLVR